MTRLVRRKDLKENMIVYGDVMNSYGGVVVNSGTVIDKRVMELFASNGIFEVRVLDTSSVDEKVEQLETHLQEIRHTKKFKEINHKYSLCYANIENQFHEVITRNRQVDKEQVIQGINNVLEKVDNTNELFDALYGMQLKQKRLYMHSLNTALISNVFARWLKYSEEEINDITLAGLFHDIGMLVVPEEVFTKKEDTLTKREREMLDHHPIYGYRYLLKSKLNRQVGDRKSVV